MSGPLLVANRGEIAVRIVRAAGALGIPSVVVHSEDDADALHVRMGDEARALRGTGAAAYLDGRQLIAVALETGCTAVHPGYGFLSENAGFARDCEAAGLTFVGPRPEVLELFGDKARARALARELGVPLLAGTDGPTTLEQARAFAASLPADGGVMVKAVAGGGGRGMRAVADPQDPEQLARAFETCRSEALAAFGSGDLYVERLLRDPRHVEVQVLGDRSGAVTHLWERDCSIQRRHQKLVEIAPSPGLAPTLRERLLAAALELARAARYDAIGTFEFLVDSSAQPDTDDAFVFIEANPRLQVEHTVTEEVTGVDLVEVQLRLAAGRTLAQLRLRQEDVAAPAGFALQVRVNLETMRADGTTQPASGVLTAYDPPSGPGVRVDGCGYAGYRTPVRFDSLLAKLVVVERGADVAVLARKAYRALSEFRIEGVPTNAGLLLSILRHPRLAAGDVDTGFLDAHLPELLAAADDHPRRFVEATAPGHDAAAARADAHAPPRALADGEVAIAADSAGVVVSVGVRAGESVRRGQPLAVVEAMKMESELVAPVGGVVAEVLVSAGETVAPGTVLLLLAASADAGEEAEVTGVVDLERVREDLREVQDRHERLLDAARPEAVARRRRTGHRTARENVADLCDPGSFMEYGGLALAAQSRRRSKQDLIERSPADGLVAGVGRVNGELFDDERARCVVLAYDYTVFAGTQGLRNHDKKDRLFELALRHRLPLVLFAEGGGGRPGDTDRTMISGLDIESFNTFGKLSGSAPLVGIAAGRCFAGNAALLGCCDVVVATEDATIGMGGPAMIEAGGLGSFRPEEVGPAAMQAANGVIDVLVADEAEAVDVARRYLSYFQGPLADWSCADQRVLRHLVPESRMRAYDVRAVVETLADEGSVLELRRGFGRGIVTALVRVEGRPAGLIANDPTHLGGAIDADGSDKAARFMQLCDAFGLPVVSLVDTPGFMVGPEAERTATVRHFARMFLNGANLSIPLFAIVLRKAYGLGAGAMLGGGSRIPELTVAWPTGELGPMGLEGMVTLGYREELEALEDAGERRALFERMVGELYEEGKALNVASVFELDDVIDPAESRAWLRRALDAYPVAPRGDRKRRPAVDAW